MKASNLNQLLNGDLSSSNLKILLQDEVLGYSKLMGKRGSSIPIIFNEDVEIGINELAINTLLLETIHGGLSSIDLAYICDCLTLGEKVTFKSEKVKDIIFGLADPEINGGFKLDNQLKEIIDHLNLPY